MADGPMAMPDGSFPIERCTGENSVEAAAKLAHHSKSYSFDQVRAHVMRAMHKLGCDMSVLPDTWHMGPSDSERQGANDHMRRMMRGG